MNELFNRIKKILENEPFKVTEEISLSSKIKDFAGWDSLTYLTFLLKIEEELAKDITPEEIRKIVTIEDLIQIISK